MGSAAVGSSPMWYFSGEGEKVLGEAEVAELGGACGLPCWADGMSKGKRAASSETWLRNAKNLYT